MDSTRFVKEVPGWQFMRAVRKYWPSSNLLTMFLHQYSMCIWSFKSQSVPLLIYSEKNLNWRKVVWYQFFVTMEIDTKIKQRINIKFLVKSGKTNAEIKHYVVSCLQRCYDDLYNIVWWVDWWNSRGERNGSWWFSQRQTSNKQMLVWVKTKIYEDSWMTFRDVVTSVVVSLTIYLYLNWAFLLNSLYQICYRLYLGQVASYVQVELWLHLRNIFLFLGLSCTELYFLFFSNLPIQLKYNENLNRQIFK